MKSKLKLNLNETDGVVKVSLMGDLDYTNSFEILDYLKSSIKDSINKLIFFTDDLEYISSEGLKAILYVKNELKSESDIIVVGKENFASDLIKDTGLDKLFTVKDNYN